MTEYISPRQRTVNFIKGMSEDDLEMFFIGNLPPDPEDPEYAFTDDLDGWVCLMNNLEEWVGHEEAWQEEWDTSIFRNIEKELHRKTIKQRIARYLRIAGDNGWQSRHKVWKKAVHERDGYVCQMCGSNKNLHAHHIKPRAEYPELDFDIDNGVTLCKLCHDKIHGRAL